MKPLLLTMVGGLLPTFLISRLTLRLFSANPGGLCLAHGLSWLVCGALAGWGMANGGPYRWDASLAYLVPQMFWLAFDIQRGANVRRA